MIKPIHAMLRILQGKVLLQDGTDVRIIKREYPADKTPCITIDNSSGSNNPNQVISQQVMREERSINLDLNIWCDDEDQRDEITEKIKTLFYQVQSDYFTFCQQYNNGNCNYLKSSCRVNPNSIRGVKGQCPKPKEYHYQNIFNAYDIIRASFDVEPPYILDDLTTTPPTLRSIIRVSFSYYDYYTIGGAVFKKLNVNEELL